MLKKKSSILWALTEPGIILQDLNNNVFFELDEVQEKIWSYIDGTHTNDDIVIAVSKKFTHLSFSSVRETTTKTIEYLLHNNLVTDN